MNLYELLTDIFASGEFSLPVNEVIPYGDVEIRTGGVLNGSIHNGVVTFSDPKPKVRTSGCVATIQKLEPQPPNAAMASSTVAGIPVPRRRITIGEPEE